LCEQVKKVGPTKPETRHNCKDRRRGQRLRSDAPSPTYHQKRKDEPRPDFDRRREAEQEAGNKGMLVTEQEGKTHHFDQKKLDVSSLEFVQEVWQ
jgi:hypothetical protein